MTTVTDPIIPERKAIDMNTFVWPVGEINPRYRVQLNCPEGSSRTKQSFKDECNINNIVDRFQATGQLPPNIREGQFADAPTIDLKGALDLIKNSRQEFDDLSPEIQGMFYNNSDNYFEFLSQYDNDKSQFETSPKTESSEKVSTRSGEDLSDDNKKAENT